MPDQSSADTSTTSSTTSSSTQVSPTATYAVSEIVGTSPTGITEAIENGIATASRSLRHLGWFEVVSIRGAIAEAEPRYQVTLKVGFRYEDGTD